MILITILKKMITITVTVIPEKIQVGFINREILWSNLAYNHSFTTNGSAVFSFPRAQNAVYKHFVLLHLLH